ncbi:MAG: DUF4140 domain-containing protein [bacterium]
MLVASPALAEGPVERVVVFGDRAQVTRKAEVRCAAGSARVEFSPLPLGLDERTVRAEATGGAEAVGTTLSTFTLAADRDGEVQAAQAAADEAWAALQAANAERDQLAQTDQLAVRYLGYVETVLVEGIRRPKPDLGAGRALDQLARRSSRPAANAWRSRPACGGWRPTPIARARVARLGPRSERRARRVEVAVDQGRRLDHGAVGLRRRRGELATGVRSALHRDRGRRRGGAGDQRPDPAGHR